MASRLFTGLLLLASALQGLAQSQKHVPVTGAPVNNTAGVGRPIRRSINDLQAEGGPQWHLYLLALSSLQLNKDDLETGYFQVSGIHGAPYIEWNGAGPGIPGDWGGYCPHSENLFLSWHRAYLALYEQILVKRAQRLALKYPEKIRDTYVKAAASLRVPYWDWAIDSRVPPSTVDPLIAIVHPSGGELVNIDNPLYTFKFPPAVLDGKYGPFDPERHPQMVRCPAPDSYPASANARLAQSPYKQWVYDVLTRARDFTEFSLGGNITSLEQIHNGIHWDAGCAGMFLDTRLTGFDPLFMLHHAFVDRIWAFWQALRPDQDVFQTAYPARARFATAAGTPVSFDSPLQPFFSDANGTFHTTVSVRTVWDLGYGYEGVEWWSRNDEQMRQDVTKLINRQYSNKPAPRRVKRHDAEATTRYFATVELDIAQVDRPSRVILYCHGRRTGSLVIMNHPKTGIVKTGFGLDSVPDVASLARTGLAANSTIRVEIVKPDGTKVPLDKVTSLKVDVHAVDVKHSPSMDKLPKYEKPVHVAEVKTGGKSSQA